MRFNGLHSTTGTGACYLTSGLTFSHLEKETYSICHDSVIEMLSGSIWIMFVEGFKNSERLCKY